jgi:uncharacterized small protein (DUF1192 family)
MQTDDERPARKPTHEIGQDLSALSVEELGERIAMLRAEITRLEAAVDTKSATRNAAEQFFRFS